MKRKWVEDKEDKEKEDEEEDKDEKKHYLVLDPPCKRCKECREQCTKEVRGKGMSCVQCIKIKKMCDWVDKGKGKEVKKRVVKKVRLEFEVGPSRVQDEDSVEDNSENSTAALWAVMDALHYIQVDNQCHHNFIIQNVSKLILEPSMVMGNAMKLFTLYFNQKTREEERQMMNRGVGTEEETTDVQSRGSREVSGSGSSQTLADQDVEMGRAEVGKSTEGSGEKEGDAGDKNVP
jgi:hypothetical protein